MAAGLPVVASDIDGMREMVTAGETGLLVAPERPEELAEALLRLVGDAPLRRSMGRAGRARVQLRFALEENHRAHRALYRRELDRRSEAAAPATAPPSQAPLRRRAMAALRRGGPRYTLAIAGRYLWLRGRRWRAGVGEWLFDRRPGVDTRGVLSTWAKARTRITTKG